MNTKERYQEKIIKVLEARNHAGLLLEAFYKSQLTTFLPRSETSCTKCLTQWTAGQFNLSVNPSNHRRKRRRQHRIDKLQKLVRTSASKLPRLKRQLEPLQEQNNHVAIYKCEVCKHSTRVQCWKPKAKQDINESVTAANAAKHEELASTAAKKNKKKKKKTAGLIIPLKRDSQPASTGAPHKQLSMAKLSSMFQQPSPTSEQMSKLNQFLK